MNNKINEIDDYEEKDSSINNIIRDSLHFYDSYQPDILKLFNKIKYVKFINNINITDEIIFYDKNDNILLQSKYEILSLYEPKNNIWKWSWSIPSILSKYNFFSRKILEYAFTLDKENEFILKSTLINSKIHILNDIQKDIYLALSAMLCKKPFIYRYYMYSEKKNNDFYYYDHENNINNPNKDNYISLFFIILDYNI